MRRLVTLRQANAILVIILMLIPILFIETIRPKAYLKNMRFIMRKYSKVEIHYYTPAHGYRFRYKASGTSVSIPESEVNNNAMGVELFNEYGYYIYHEYDLTMTFKNDNTVAINN